ncbi:hypothetical protein QF023_003717 [Chryseobacterium sp. SLBN-27]|uniref:hypothetical protein n=1 Tax=Chryseobacterium sp. SLBN-27 TaxID=3042287 RepID=UPI00285F2187|nr:hypothetical protein [Chryseobacterium sp. SLBN-27]MDR6160201.1 hypothetical protein [Chryseobacterium sp. SLBN-27]
MKKTLFLPLIILISCNSLNTKGKKQYVKNFKKDFKKAAFCHCILYGYNNKKVTSFITEVDKSFYSPIIGSVFSKELNEIAINEYALMKEDSLLSIESTSEANAGKKVINHCLAFYESKKLDSLTNIQYKRWKNIKNIDSLTEVKNPAY